LSVALVLGVDRVYAKSSHVIHLFCLLLELFII
jgi:hypothetical protein